MLFCIRFKDLFTPTIGFFSPFPHRYLSTIGYLYSLGLEDGTPFFCQCYLAPTYSINVQTTYTTGLSPLYISCFRPVIKAYLTVRSPLLSYISFDFFHQLIRCFSSLGFNILFLYEFSLWESLLSEIVSFFCTTSLYLTLAHRPTNYINTKVTVEYIFYLSSNKKYV